MPTSSSLVCCASPCLYRPPSLSPSHFPNAPCRCPVFRISNMIQLGQLAAALAAAPESHVIVAGDLNSNPSTLEMALLRHLAPCLGDAWAELHPAEDGWTCNAPDNTWSARPQTLRFSPLMLFAATAHSAAWPWHLLPSALHPSSGGLSASSCPPHPSSLTLIANHA